ncbi:hypothetical protein ACHAXR_007331, partial [Thalassiosira sp. AJA248-18]
MTIPDKHNKYAPVSAVPITGRDNDALGERFIALAVDVQSSEAQPLFGQVVAPATLPEGYTFEAEANGHSFTVKVPVGGVEEGQKLSVPFPAGSNGYSQDRRFLAHRFWGIGRTVIVVVSVMVYVIMCFGMLLVGQIMQRLKLTWLGNEGGTPAQTKATLRILVLITVVYIVTNHGILTCLQLAAVDEYGPTDQYFYVLNVRDLLALSFRLFLFVLVCKTRKRIREKYSIPEEHKCDGFEDCCCAYWCTCCTLVQMARHTDDYETYAGLCCSEAGMPLHAPSI